MDETAENRERSTHNSCLIGRKLLQVSLYDDLLLCMKIWNSNPVYLSAQRLCRFWDAVQMERDTLRLWSRSHHDTMWYSALVVRRTHHIWVASSRLRRMVPRHYFARCSTHHVYWCVREELEWEKRERKYLILSAQGSRAHVNVCQEAMIYLAKIHYRELKDVRSSHDNTEILAS